MYNPRLPTTSWGLVFLGMFFFFGKPRVINNISWYQVPLTPCFLALAPLQAGESDAPRPLYGENYGVLKKSWSPRKGRDFLLRNLLTNVANQICGVHEASWSTSSLRFWFRSGCEVTYDQPKKQNKKTRLSHEIKIPSCDDFFIWFVISSSWASVPQLRYKEPSARWPRWGRNFATKQQFVKHIDEILENRGRISFPLIFVNPPQKKDVDLLEV